MLTVYSSNTTSFSNLGIGALKDFTSNPLITEELNGAYTLEFSYAKDGYLSEYLVEQNIIKANGQPFRIWNVKKDMKSITILAKHIFFDLSFNFLADVYPKNLTSQGALAWLISHAQTPTNFTVSGNCTVVSNARYVRKNIVDAIYNEDNALLERFGGELSFDNFAITVNETRGTNANFSIRYKKNLVGIDFNLDFSNVATRIIPIGFDGITIDSLYVESPKVGNYFTPLYKTYEFSNIKYDPDDEEAYHTLEEAKQALTSAANDLFNKDVDIPQISVKVNFVELSKCTEYESYSNLETVHLGDTIDVIVPELNIKTKARVVKTVYDCILKRFTTLEIGNVTPSATTNQIEVNNQVKKTENYINEAQKNAENLINHPFKGNLYIDSTPGSGVIYFMDTTNPATAQSIWKWSIGGLGYSPNGINGTYTIGITQDGKINADFITTGHLNTSVIEGYDSLVIQVNQNTNNLIPTDSLESSDNTYHFEDAAESNLVNFEIDGKSIQETTTGKNLAGTILIGKVWNDGSNPDRACVYAYIQPNTTYTISFGSLAGIDRATRFEKVDIHSTTATVGTADITGTTTITTNSNSNVLGIQFNKTSVTQQDIDNIKIQIEQGSTATEYEPYTGGQPSPNPDYPQEIESVGGYNLWENTNTLSYVENLSDYTLGKWYKPTYITFVEDGEYNYYTRNANSNYCVFLQKIPYSKVRNKTITVSIEYQSEYQKNMAFSYQLHNTLTGTRTCYRDYNITYKQTDIWTKLSQTVTITDDFFTSGTRTGNEQYFAIGFYIGVSSGTNNVKIRKPQLTISNNDLPYAPSNNIAIKTVGKNLFNLNANYATQGITINGKGSEFTLNGTTVQNTTFMNYISLGTLNAGTYTITWDVNISSVTRPGGDAAFYIRSSSDNLQYASRTIMQLQNSGGKAVDTFTLTENTSIVIQAYSNIAGIVFNNTLFKMQIEYGSTSTTYEPYKEQTQLITLDEPLRSLPNGVRDKLRIENNTLYVDRYIGRVVFNGSESWRNDAGTVGDDYRHNIKFQDIQLPNSATRRNGLSNYFHSDYVTRDGIWEKGEFYCNGEWIVIWDKNQNYNLNNFKSWLSTHPTEVIYQLAEPTTEVVGEMKLPTLLNTNNIDIYSNIITDSSLTYSRNVDLANYINNQIVSSEASIKVTTDGIEQKVSQNTGLINETNTQLTAQGLDINVLHTNIDADGNVNSIRTKEKHFTLNDSGLTIAGDTGFKSISDETGTYYYNGNDITGQYTKDGSKQKDLYLFGAYRYGMDDIDDTPMFVAQKYTKVVNGVSKQVIGHFLNK